MKVLLAADHRGFELKEALKKLLISERYEVEDIGAPAYNPHDDYVDFAQAAIEKVMKNPDTRAILICGSGHGMDIVANKYKGIRAALAFNRQVAAQSREHEDSNILVLASDWTTADQAKDIIGAWVRTQFTGAERHVRRLHTLEEIEKKNFR